MLIDSIALLEKPCKQVTESGKAETHEITIDVLLEKGFDGEYIFSPILSTNAKGKSSVLK